MYFTLGFARELIRVRFDFKDWIFKRTETYNSLVILVQSYKAIEFVSLQIFYYVGKLILKYHLSFFIYIIRTTPVKKFNLQVWTPIVSHWAGTFYISRYTWTFLYQMSFYTFSVKNFVKKINFSCYASSLICYVTLNSSLNHLFLNYI